MQQVTVTHLPNESLASSWAVVEAVVEALVEAVGGEVNQAVTLILCRSIRTPSDFM